MKRQALKAAVALLASAIASVAHAGIQGYFDKLNVASTDTAYGWICDTSNFSTAPAGELVIYVAGSYYGEVEVANVWGGYRPDVPSGGFCGTNNYTGWAITGWFATPNSPGTQIYYRHPGGTLELLGGSGKVCPNPGDCY